MAVVDVFPEKEDIYIITGPTAGGKTDIAQSLALLINGEIISADSRAFYMDLNIGTGAYTIDDPTVNHMVSFLGLEERYSLYDYLFQVGKIIDNLRSKGKNIIICGGTMLYIERLIIGLDRLSPPDQLLRKELESFRKQRGNDELHSLLQKMDPVLGKEIHPNNVKRVIRSIEIARGKDLKNPIEPITGIKGVYFIYRDIDEFKKRIRERVDQMIEKGWVEEVEVLIGRGATGSEPAFESLGYDIILSHIKGKLSLDDVRKNIYDQHLRLYRSQMKWLNKIPSKKVNISGLKPSEVVDMIRFSV